MNHKKGCVLSVIGKKSKQKGSSTYKTSSATECNLFQNLHVREILGDNYDTHRECWRENN